MIQFAPHVAGRGSVKPPSVLFTETVVLQALFDFLTQDIQSTTKFSPDPVLESAISSQIPGLFFLFFFGKEWSLEIMVLKLDVLIAFGVLLLQSPPRRQCQGICV